MAGIGFKLEKILSKNSYLSTLEGYAYSAIVSAGPLLFTIFSIALMGMISHKDVGIEGITIFKTIIVYIYGFSLILSSPAQMIITRYMADRIYLKDYKAIVPSFIGISVLSVVIHALVGFGAALHIDLDFGTKMTSVVLFINIGLIWISMIVLSAAKEYMRVVYSYLIGASISVIASFGLGKFFGLTGITVGYTLGQVILVILLITQIFSEFEYRQRIEFYFLSYFKKLAALAIIATLYNIGIWVDKFIFWFNPETREQIYGFLYASPIYDAPVFLAYLFIVPSLALFTIRVETSFYIQYKKYFLAIMNKHPYFSIEERRRHIVNDLRLSMGRLIVMQGTITAIGLFMAPAIYELLGMSAMNLGIFHIAILGTFLQALLQTLIIIILYFDFRTDALIVTLIFSVTNAIFSQASIGMGFSYYGYGYFFSCLVSLVTGFALFNYRIKHLLFYTFVNQRIIIHKDLVKDEISQE